jgi:hypothetical protein
VQQLNKSTQIVSLAHVNKEMIMICEYYPCGWFKV